MRLWHKDMIDVLPRQQLLSQWRECCCIAKNIQVNGTPNHILVNKILSYDMAHFVCYAIMIKHEMIGRGYKCDFSKFSIYIKSEDLEGITSIKTSDLFNDWHNERYLLQCLYNLEEKYDCGGVTEKEWDNVYHKYYMYLDY